MLIDVRELHEMPAVNEFNTYQDPVSTVSRQYFID